MTVSSGFGYIDVSLLAKGIYILNIQVNERWENRKLVVM